ncbi:MAG TPA: hypothetical protein VNT03_08880 [Baekduia sp.]|nr:hypothetical protein [Baekduia sp.]
MRRRIVALLATAALVGIPAAAPAATHQPNAPVAVAAKTCGAGYTHAVIGGQHKCLRRGQFCATRYAKQYRRYGFTCTAGRLR